MQAKPLVLDTNIVLDVWVFNDAKTALLKQAIETGEFEWLATKAMRDELERVLAYPKIASRLHFYKLIAEDVLGKFDCHAKLIDVAPKAHATCTDADDQKFIDLAVVHQALLLSKDNAVTSMAKRLVVLGVRARVAM